MFVIAGSNMIKDMIMINALPLVRLFSLNIDVILTNGTYNHNLKCFSEKSDTDRHPEKRLKAAYTAFEEANLPILKAENPTLRLSQLKQMLRKEWLKSPQNPLNMKV